MESWATWPGESSGPGRGLCPAPGVSPHCPARVSCSSPGNLPSTPHLRHLLTRGFLCPLAPTLYFVSGGLLEVYPALLCLWGSFGGLSCYQLLLLHQTLGDRGSTSEATGCPRVTGPPLSNRLGGARDTPQGNRPRKFLRSGWARADVLMLLGVSPAGN